MAGVSLLSVPFARTPLVAIAAVVAVTAIATGFARFACGLTVAPALAVTAAFPASLAMTAAFPASLAVTAAFPASLAMTAAFAPALAVTATFPASLAMIAAFPAGLAVRRIAGPSTFFSVTAAFATCGVAAPTARST